MAACPSCQRPIAISRPRCLYCGVALDPALVPPPPPEPAAGAAELPALAAPSEPAPERTLVVIGFQSPDVAPVAEALALAPFEVAQRMRRGGWHLHKVLAPDAAAVEGERLQAAGLAVRLVPEVEVRPSAEPIAVTGGTWSEPHLRLHTSRGDRALAAGDLLLIVSGAIQREYPAEFRRNLRLAALTPGHRFHLHTRGEALAFELDPDAFVFDTPSPVPMSSLLELRSWIAGLTPVPVDDGFRSLPPALGPSPTPDPTAFAALRAGKKEGAPVHDNLRQFRFYSGWRAAVERRA
jgi:hypothetical protein